MIFMRKLLLAAPELLAAALTFPSDFFSCRDDASLVVHASFDNDREMDGVGLTPMRRDDQ
jgi:hypothetical protein